MEDQHDNLQIEVEFQLQPDAESYSMMIPLEGEALDEFTRDFAMAIGEYQVRRTREVLEEDYPGAGISVSYELLPLGQFPLSPYHVYVAAGDDTDLYQLEKDLDLVVDQIVGDSWDAVIEDGMPDPDLYGQPE